MSHINKVLLTELQIQLTLSFAELRQDIINILNESEHKEHHLTAIELEKASPDELVETLNKIEIYSISEKTLTLKSIDAALNNIEIGMYGLCADCEAEIEINQLVLHPTIQRCPVCENKYNKYKSSNYRL